MNEKLFLYFFRKIGSVTFNGHEYAFCHPMKLKINKKGDVIVACTVVDKEGNFYDLSLSWVDYCLDNWGKLLIERIGKIEELPVKNIQEIISYLERRGVR
jgi:hypothetical protein